jgi:hypothetical protein
MRIVYKLFTVTMPTYIIMGIGTTFSIGSRIAKSVFALLLHLQVFAINVLRDSINTAISIPSGKCISNNIETPYAEIR